MALCQCVRLDTRSERPLGDFLPDLFFCRWGLGVLRVGQPLHLMELGAARKTPSESQAGKAGVKAA